MDGEVKIPPIFQPFVDLTNTEFEYLVTDFGFQRKAEEAVGSEAWVVYEKPTTRITVHYELGAEPWVEVGRLEQREGRLVQPQSIGLDLLLRERGQAFTDDVDVPQDLTEPELSLMLKTRAQRLREVGEEFLRGNFESFPRLQTKAEKELQKRESELFGSKT